MTAQNSNHKTNSENETKQHNQCGSDNREPAQNADDDDFSAEKSGNHGERRRRWTGEAMLLDVILRVQANTIEHLGARDLERLRAFEMGYTLAQPVGSSNYPFEDTFRYWVIEAYKPTFNVSNLSAYTILQVVAPDMEDAFSAFFFQLDRALEAHEAIWSKGVPLKKHLTEAPLPVSAYLQALTKRPGMFLPRTSPGCLRAFLDGVRLARIDEGQPQYADLDNFEPWIEEKLNLRKVSRWENAVQAHFASHEREAFNWALQELKQFRATLGPLPEKHYEIESHKTR